MAEAHYICMVVIGVGSFIFGILPICFSSRATRSNSFLLSLILCLGAGVLLATSIVHMLTEVQIKLKMYAQLYFCCGFFILYAFDEFSHFWIIKKQCASGEAQPEVFDKLCEKKRNYGSTNNYPFKQTCFLESKNSKQSKEQLCEVSSSNQYLKRNHSFESIDGIKYFEKQLCNISSSNDQCSAKQWENKYNTICYDAKVENRPHSSNVENIGYSNSEIKELSLSNPVAKTGLLVALVIHSVLEGLSIGVQTNVSQIYLILGAVTFHKIVLSFCLGLELLSYGSKKIYLFFSIFIFSVGSSFGIYIGMLITSFSSIFNVDDQLQAIAAGSLLYVAAFEVLPRERYLWKQKNIKRAAGVFQLLFVLFGFGFITALSFVSDHFHGRNTTESNQDNNFTTPPF